MEAKLWQWLLHTETSSTTICPWRLQLCWLGKTTINRELDL